MSDRVQPHDLVAERAVLGAVLLDNDALALVQPILHAKDFYRAAHSRLFEEMVTLSEKRAPIDPVTLASSLRRQNVLDDCGGPAYISSLTDGLPRSSSIEAYAKIVRDHASRRALIRVASDVLTDAYDTEKEVGHMIEAAEHQLFAVAERRVTESLMPMSEIVTQAWPTLEAQMNADGRALGLPTGFGQLDKLLNGLRAGQLIIIAARPGVGKTSLAMNVAHFLTSVEHKTVAVFSIEMSREELFTRHLAAVAQVSGFQLLRGSLPETQLQRVGDALGTIASAPLYVDETGLIGVLEIRSKARALRQRVGLDAIVIDYIQLMVGDDEAENRTQQLAMISRSLKALAKELKIPVIVLSQLSRASEQRKDKRPQLWDLRESGALEQDADVVLMIHREEEYDPKEENRGIAELLIRKSRNGPSGTVKVLWVADQTRFADIASKEMF